jgi:hypothetical protein
MREPVIFPAPLESKPKASGDRLIAAALSARAGAHHDEKSPGDETHAAADGAARLNSGPA